MRVWFYPVSEPGVYVVLRPDTETTIVCLSDGLTVEQVAEASAALGTVEERDWVRAYVGAPACREDPTYDPYATIDKQARGEPLWDRSMIPEGLLWTGKVPCGEHKETAEREVASDGPAP